MGIIQLNGTNFYPSDAPISYSKVGVTLVAANGTRRFAHRTTGGTPIFKASWDLQWNMVTHAVRVAVATIHALTTTFTYKDQDGTNWTVQCEDGGYSDSVAFIAGNGDLYYNVTLKIFQV